MGKHVAGGCQVVVRKVGRWHRGQYCLCGAMPASGWAERALLCELTLFASTSALLVSVCKWPDFWVVESVRLGVVVLRGGIGKAGS